MPRISVGDGDLYYERHGSGFPILFITGLGGMAAYWREQLPAFCDKFQVITHDHRGVGKSDQSRITYSVDQMAADALHLMDALGLDKVHIVGHSTGGAVAQILAIEHPDRLASIVLAGSWPRADDYFRRLFAMRKALLASSGPAAYLKASTLFLYPPFWIAQHSDKIAEAEAAALAGFSDPEIIASRIDAVVAFDRRDQLSRIRTPTLVIGAEDDTITPAYFSEDLARLIPGAELKLFARGGHCFTQVMARDFDRAVLPFLEAHSGS